MRSNRITLDTAQLGSFIAWLTARGYMAQPVRSKNIALKMIKPELRGHERSVVIYGRRGAGGGRLFTVPEVYARLVREWCGTLLGRERAGGTGGGSGHAGA